ncbi:hypothetical protein DFJ77DRAFT_443280 [Powellomyces hirtus]|nr:hypothetical protein DFJ77DRAFT_443280 [Powellomyces hirtus]
MAYHSKTGEKLCDLSLKPLYDKGIKIHLGKKGAEYTTSEDNKTVTVSLQDGESVTGDLLIIAEGTHSKLRNKVISHIVAGNYVGYVNYNGGVPVTSDLGDPTKWNQFVGETAPDLGQGGCQAMEDAWVLANALKTHPNDLHAALKHLRRHASQTHR